MAVCCQNLPLGALISRSAFPVPVGALFKKFRLLLNTPCILGTKSTRENEAQSILITRIEGQLSNRQFKTRALLFFGDFSKGARPASKMVSILRLNNIKGYAIK
jgi:hypothetical protein